MKIEIAHDSLARHIYEKSDAEDKNRLKIKNFIATRHNFYKENKSLLKTEDLHYIERYVDDLELTEEQQNFIKRSERAERNRIQLAILTTVGVIVVLLALLIWALTSGYQIRQSKDLLALQASELEHKTTTLDSLNHELLYKNDALENEKIRNENLVDSLAKKNNIKANFDKLSDAQKKAMILTLMGDRKRLQTDLEGLKTISDDFKTASKDLKNLEKQLKQAQSTKKHDIKAAAEKEKKRVEHLWEKKLNEALKTKNQELTQTKSVALAVKAENLFNNGDLKTSFQLASEAYKLNKRNKEAIAVLRKIAKRKTDIFGQKYGPSIKDPEQIIQRFDKTYGRMNGSVIQQRYFR